MSARGRGPRMCAIGIADPTDALPPETLMTFENNEHFKSMRRTPRETLAFAVMAVVATLATTMLAVAPASATGTKHARVAVETSAAVSQR
jgi:hypothetical protein